jgi:hypothetical protein
MPSYPGTDVEDCNSSNSIQLSKRRPSGYEKESQLAALIVPHWPRHMIKRELKPEIQRKSRCGREFYYTSDMPILLSKSSQVLRYPSFLSLDP